MRFIDNIGQIDSFQWEDLLAASATRSFFQTRACYDFYAANPSFMEAFCFAVEQAHCLKGVIVGYIQRDGGRLKQFLSRRAIINGGPLLAADISGECLAFLLDNCRRSLKDKAIYVESRNFEDFSSYREVFERSGFRYEPHLNFHIDTSTADAVEEHLGKSRKRDIKLSLRDGAQIVENPSLEEVRGFYALLRELYRTRVKTPLFPLSFFERLYERPEARFLLVRYAEKIVGGTVCVCLPGYAVYEWFACGEDGVYKNIHPSTLATYAGILYAAQHGFSHFDMMGAGKPDDAYGVREFKAKFGGKQIEYGRFLSVLKPLLYQTGRLGVKLMKCIPVKK